MATLQLILALIAFAVLVFGSGAGITGEAWKGASPFT